MNIAAIDAYEQLRKDVQNVLDFASPDMPADTKKDIMRELSLIGDEALDLGDELEHESIVSDKRVERARKILTKRFVGRMSGEGWLDDTELSKEQKQNFINSLMAH